MGLATIDELKRWRGISESVDDALLTDCLSAATEMMERYCQRLLEHAAADITQVVDGGVERIHLRGWPVSTLSVKVADDYDFAAATAETPNGSYRLTSRGVLVRLPDGAVWPDGVENIQVVYRCGYYGGAGDPPAGVESAPDHIRRACVLQASHIYDRRLQPGATSVSFGGPGSVTLQSDLVLLDGVKDLLSGERRLLT